MRKRAIIFTAILFVISLGNYFRITLNAQVRSVDFISIFAIGVLAGVLLTQIVVMLRNKNKLS